MSHWPSDVTLVLFSVPYNQLPEDMQRRIDKIFEQRIEGDDGPITWEEWKSSQGAVAIRAMA